MPLLVALLRHALLLLPPAHAARLRRTPYPPASGSDFQAVQRLESAVMGMVEHRGQPGVQAALKGMKGLIENIQEKIPLQHQHAAQLLGNMKESFESCNVANGTIGQAARSAAKTVASHKLRHSECRTEEGLAAEVLSECSSVQTSLQGSEVVSCSALHALESQPNYGSNVCSPSGDESYGNWLARNEEWFKKHNAEFGVAKGSCSNATGSAFTHGQQCSGMKRSLSGKRAACNGLQSQLEQAACSVGTMVTTACANQASCYSRALGRYNENVRLLLRQAEVRQIEWRVLMRLSCLVEVMGDADSTEAQLDNCIAREYSFEHLLLDSPEPPQPAPCSPVEIANVALPCTPEWALYAYKDLPEHAQAQNCSACPMVDITPLLPSNETVAAQNLTVNASDLAAEDDAADDAASDSEEPVSSAVTDFDWEKRNPVTTTAVVTLPPWAIGDMREPPTQPPTQPPVVEPATTSAPSEEEEQALPAPALPDFAPPTLAEKRPPEALSRAPAAPTDVFGVDQDSPFAVETMDSRPPGADIADVPAIGPDTAEAGALQPEIPAFAGLINRLQADPGGASMQLGQLSFGESSLTLGVGVEETSVEFAEAFQEPPVVVVLPLAGASSAVVRVYDVSPTGFKALLLERGERTLAGARTATFFAALPGVHKLKGGRVLEAGRHSTSAEAAWQDCGRGRAIDGWESLEFWHAFERTPAVVAGTQTMRNERSGTAASPANPFVSVATAGVARRGFFLALERAGGRREARIPEVVGYIAMTQGRWSLPDQMDCVATMAHPVGKAPAWVPLYTDLGSAGPPLVVASLASKEDGWLRLWSARSAWLEVSVDEDSTCKSRKVRQASAVSIIACSSPFQLR